MPGLHQLFETLRSYLIGLVANIGLPGPFARWGVSFDQLALAAAAILFAVVAAGLIRRSSRMAREGGSDLKARTRPARLLGHSTIAILTVGFGGWAMIAPLASAALAPGVVSPEGSRRVVQHLEGGIVSEILVQEGQVVVAGQPLVILQDIKAQGEFRQIKERWYHLLATADRLVAEQSGDGPIVFSEALKSGSRSDAEASLAMKSQSDLLLSRRETLAGRKRILKQRIVRLEEEIAALQAAVDAQGTQITLTAEEVVGVAALAKKNLVTVRRTHELKRLHAGLTAARAENMAEIAQRQRLIGNAEYELIAISSDHREKVDEELAKVRAELAEVRSLLPSREDIVSRTMVTAPINGVVLNMNIKTETGVIGSGEPILEIVPNEARLLIDARVRPLDIDSVHAGMPARIVLTAFPQRNLPQITGTVLTISADRLTDERTGEAYFLAQVEVNDADAAKLPNDLKMSPGMPADVMVMTGERTLLDYLIRPLMDSLTKSFRET